MLITYLRYGFDFGKCNQFFLIIDSFINEKSTVDVAAQALGPLLAVKGLHAHSHFDTAEGDTGRWAENQSSLGLLCPPPPPPPPSTKENEGPGFSSMVCKSMQWLKSISPGRQIRCASPWGHLCFTFPLSGGKKASCEFVYIHEHILVMGRGV